MAKTETNLLNDVALRQLVRAGEQCAKSDGGGLTFTLSAAGTAAWVLRYRHGGRRYELTLGRYPDLTLKDARLRAAELRVDVQRGVNPATVLRASKTRRDWSVRQLVVDYRETILCSLAPSTQASYGRNLKRVSDGMGSISVTDVTAADVIAQLERTQVGWVERYSLWVVLKAIFRHAAGKKLIPQNPCIGIELAAVIGKRPEIRTRLMLETDEITQLLNANMSVSNRNALAIMLATGVRVSEMYAAVWADVYIEEGRWHIPTNKLGRAFDIPLAPPVQQWFRELKAEADRSLMGKSKYVLPARRMLRYEKASGDATISKDVIWRAIDYWHANHNPTVRRFTPHDLRSTMKSHLKRLGVGRDVSEMCLNHKLTGLDGIYDQYTYWDERKAALTLWADFLVTCRDAGGNVIFGKFGTAA